MRITSPCLRWIPLTSHSHHPAQIKYQTTPNVLPRRDAVPTAPCWRKPPSCCAAAHTMPTAAGAAAKQHRKCSGLNRAPQILWDPWRLSIQQYTGTFLVFLEFAYAGRPNFFGKNSRRLFTFPGEGLKCTLSTEIT